MLIVGELRATSATRWSSQQVSGVLPQNACPQVIGLEGNVHLSVLRVKRRLGVAIFAGKWQVVNQHHITAWISQIQPVSLEVGIAASEGTLGTGKFISESSPLYA